MGEPASGSSPDLGTAVRGTPKTTQRLAETHGEQWQCSVILTCQAEVLFVKFLVR